MNGQKGKLQIWRRISNQYQSVHACECVSVLRTTAVVAQWDMSSLFWIPVQFQTQTLILLLWWSLALVWLVVRNHDPYSPCRTDLTMRNKSRLWTIELHYAKGYILRAYASCAKSLLPLWKTPHGNTIFMWNSFLGSDHIRGFITLMIYCSHRQECMEIPACYAPPRRNVFSTDENFNLSSVSAGNTKRPQQYHIPTAFTITPPPKCLEHYRLVIMPKRTTAFM